MLEAEGGVHMPVSQDQGQSSILLELSSPLPCCKGGAIWWWHCPSSGNVGQSPMAL